MISVDKINIAFASGSFIEKPLISAFKGANGNYVVLDNEINGAMGLPIILVTKYNDHKFAKITDQNEWNGVKEYLRNIISGNQMDYIKVEDKVTADENFFLQLTLPVASYESLKANYKPNEDGASSKINAISTPEVPVNNNPVQMPTPTPEVPSPVPPIEQNAKNDVVNQTPTPTPTPIPTVVPQDVPAPQAPASEVIASPAVEQPTPVAPASPVAPTPQVEMPSPSPVNPENIPAQPGTTVEKDVDFTADKEAFLKACENMFDALVAKFNK